jgi:hypothetical protein
VGHLRLQYCDKVYSIFYKSTLLDKSGTILSVITLPEARRITINEKFFWNKSISRYISFDELRNFHIFHSYCTINERENRHPRARYTILIFDNLAKVIGQFRNTVLQKNINISVAATSLKTHCQLTYGQYAVSRILHAICYTRSTPGYKLLSE